MTYYLIRNKDGFEEIVLEGTMEEAETQKLILELRLPSSEEECCGWSRVKYYVFPETEWKMDMGTMH